MKADRSGWKRTGAEAFCLAITIRLSGLIGANTCIHEQAKMTMSGSDKVGYSEYTWIQEIIKTLFYQLKDLIK